MKAPATNRARTLLLLLAAAAISGSCESLIGLHDRKFDGAAGKRSANAGEKAPPPGSKAALCKAFCKHAIEACPGEFAIFHEAECPPACDLLEVEEIECRDQQLSRAASSKELGAHCQYASLASAECGQKDNCGNYCALMDKVCGVTNPFRDEAEVTDCVKKCKALPNWEQMPGLPASVPSYAVDRDHEGDTLQCRFVHLAIAAGPSGAEAHCWHAAIAPRPQPNGTMSNPCATTKAKVTEPLCSDYCQIVMISCVDKNRVYENVKQCNAVCEVLNKGHVSDVGLASDPGGPDSVGCRKIHSYNALLYEPTKHCPHAGPGGAGACGTDCPAYCRMVKAGCEAGFKAKYGAGPEANTKCEEECAPVRGPNHLAYSVSAASDKSAPPLACRLLHAARVLELKQPQLCEIALGDKPCPAP